MALEGFTEYDPEDIEKYNRYRWWLGMTWGDVLDRVSDLYPEKTGLVDDKASLSNRELRDRTDRLALGLMDLGIGKGDRVLLQVPNWAEYVYCFFALQKIGAIPVLLLPRHTELEINYLSRLTGPRAWIFPFRHKRSEFAPLVEKVLAENHKIEHVLSLRAEEGTPFLRVEDLIRRTTVTTQALAALALGKPDPMEVAQIMPTGGTTGLPKAAPRTHNSFLCNVEYHSRAWEITSNDTVLTVAPVSHGQGMFCGVGGAIFNFAKLVLIDSTDPADICRVIEKERVTALPTVPPLIIRLMNYEGRKNHDLSSLQKVYAGGAASTPELARSVREKLGCTFVNAFGSVEGTNAMTRLHDPMEIVCNTVGRKCCPYETYKIIDRESHELPPGREGELVSKGPGIFTGYFKSGHENSSIFTKDGFLRTGDLAIMDERENIRITGRIKDIIIRGGENISANDIEALIGDHPLVKEVAVVGMPDAELGERVCAYVQAMEGGPDLTLDEIVSFLKNRGASVLKLPERLELLESLPLTKAGKPDKKALREDIRRRIGLSS